LETAPQTSVHSLANFEPVPSAACQSAVRGPEVNGLVALLKTAPQAGVHKLGNSNPGSIDALP
jgi:hypothetical protein